MNIKIKVGGVEFLEVSRKPMSPEAQDTIIGVLAILIICGMFVFGFCMMGR